MRVLQRIFRCCICLVIVWASLFAIVGCGSPRVGTPEAGANIGDDNDAEEAAEAEAPSESPGDGE